MNRMITDYYFDSPYDCDYREKRPSKLSDGSTRHSYWHNNKDAKIQWFLHYSDPQSRTLFTVFGEPKKELFYNYDDRLFGERWEQGCELAKARYEPGTPNYYQFALNHFHETDTVDLQHILLGCNSSSGYSYLVFGYTYDSSNGK